MSMRKIFLMLVLLLTLGVGEAFAVEATGSSKREKAQERVATMQEKVEERKAEIQQRIELQKEKMASKAQEIRRRLTEKRKAAIRLHFSRMYRRMNAAVTRLDTVPNRVESR